MKKNIFLLYTCFLVTALFISEQLFPSTPKPIRPVILTLKKYPLSKKEIDFLKKVNPYGILLFEYSFKAGLDPKLLKRKLQLILQRKDLLFFIDQEGGSVNRLKSLLPHKRYPAPKTLGNFAKRDLAAAVEKSYQYGFEMGKDIRSQGFDVNFAPSAELCREKNFLGDRCFSEDPQTTALLAASFAEGMAHAGVAPVYKHIPGIASGGTDPHNGHAIINRPLRQLQENELYAMKDAGKWDYMMIGHGIFQAIDEKRISTYSPAFYQFVRKYFSFDGLIITDALNMKTALLPGKSRGEQMNLALTAGADIVMPFFSSSLSFKNRWKEIKKISPKQISAFNKKLENIKNKKRKAL